MKVELGIGITCSLIGLALMVTGQRMCRTSCWVDRLVELLLPASHASWAGELPVLLVGLAIVGHAICRRLRPAKTIK
ncbi:hypothetical protein AAFF27_04050 [Xylophilus sp. GW821-FHT01B05]